MATRKKVAKKTTKKVTTKRPAKRAKRTNGATTTLTTTERQRKLKPRRDYPEIVDTFLRVWEENPSVKLTNLTRAQLRSALSAALKAAAKEDALRRQFESKLRGLQDARLIAEDALWRKLLDANALVKAQSRVDARIGNAFAFLTDALRPDRDAEQTGSAAARSRT